MTRLEESFSVAQRQLTGAEAALLMVQREGNEYSRRFDVKKQRHGNLESLLRIFRNGWDDLKSLVKSAWGFLRLDNGCNH